MKLDDSNYSAILQAMSEMNANLENNPLHIVAQIDKIDQVIDQLKGTDEEIAVALGALWQVRNTLARLSSDEVPETNTPRLLIEYQYVNEVLNKFVGVYSSNPQNLDMMRACLLPMAEHIRCELYASLSTLIENILANRLSGIIALHHNPKEIHALGQLIKAELATHHSMWGAQSDDLILPVIYDVFPPYAIGEIFRVFRHIHDGEYYYPCLPFSLTEAMPGLLAHMYGPKQKLRIIVVDKANSDMDGMREILLAWPNVVIDAYKIHPADRLEVNKDAAAILLEDRLSRNIRGVQILQDARRCEFKGLVVSTTLEGRPDWAEWHFGLKQDLKSSRDRAILFIRFMNRVIKQIEQI